MSEGERKKEKEGERERERERERDERDHVIRRVKLLDMMGLGKQSFTKTDTSE